MRAMTDDGAFGVDIEVAPPEFGYDARFFSFQLLVGGRVVGDDDESIVYGAVQALKKLPKLADPRLHEPERAPKTVIEAVLTDSDCNHALSVQCESLDSWLVVAYMRGEDAVWIVDQFVGERRAELAGNPTVVIVPRRDYETVIAKVATYWEAHAIPG